MVAAPKTNDELMTVSEVATLLRVDDTTVRRWVKQGALEAIVLPHVNARQAYRIKRETLNTLLGIQPQEQELPQEPTQLYRVARR